MDMPATGYQEIKRRDSYKFLKDKKWIPYTNSKDIQVFILLWIFLQNIVVSFGGNLLAIYYKKAEIRDAHLQKQIETTFYISPEDYCIGGGGILGGILILILSQSVDIKSHFCAIRCIQIISIGVIGLFYKLQNYEWSHDYWTFGIYSIFFMQGAIECMSQVLTPVYIMDTVCDRDLDEPVAFLLLVTTQIPMHISSFCAQLLSVNHLFLTLGVGIFGGIFFLVFLFYVFLPRSFQDGEENEKSEYVDYWHLQFEGESGWLRPAATSIGVCILAEMCGSQIYQFYCPWALRLVHSPISPELLTSAVSFITLLTALTIWTKERLPYFLMISTATLSLCSFLSGIFLHGLETNGSIFSFAPLSIYILYTIAYSSGLGSLGEIISVLITPRSYRLNILTIAVVLSFLSQRLSKAVIPTLIQNLHPFGVFWLYSGIVLFGLLYMAVAIVGQLKHRGQAAVPGQTTVEEFITQV